MNPQALAQEIIDGRRLTRQDDLKAFLTCDLQELCEGADKIRKHFGFVLYYQRAQRPLSGKLQILCAVRT